MPPSPIRLAARPGDRLEIGGPRGSAIVPADFDWYWLVGDETALPAIGRWVEEAPSGSTITTFVVIEDLADRQRFQSEAEWAGVWPVRAGRADDAALLRDAMAMHDFPAGDGFIWIAAEASVARMLRSYVLEHRHHPREWVKAGGYWVRGEADAHDKLDD